MTDEKENMAQELKFTVGKKLGLGIAITMFIFALIGTISYVNIALIIENDRWTEHTHEVLNKIDKIFQNVTDAETGQRGFLLTGEENYLEPYTVAVKDVDESIEEVKKLTADNPEEQQNINNVQVLVGEKLSELKETIDLHNTQGPDAALAVVKTNKGKDIMDNIRKELDKMRDVENRLLVERQEASQHSNQFTKFTIILGSLFALLLMFVMGIVLGRSIVNPIRQMVDKMNVIRKTGDLTQKVEVRTSDELSLLALSFNEMQNGLSQIVSNIQDSSLKLNTSCNQILAAMNEQDSATTEQSSQMTQIQTTLNEAASAAEELSRTAREVSRFSQEAGKAADEGMGLIKESNNKMTALKESNKGVSDKLVVLNQKIEGINKMLTTILSVADQTNLLSLNAAIEASKAGEQGKGFSVVAQEIRRLADQTAQSSKEIAGLIKEIEIASSSATMVMEKSSQEVQSSTQLMAEFASRFAAITEHVQKVLPQIENIATTISQQTAGNKEIASSVTQMTQALKGTASSLKQTRQSASDLTIMGQQLRQAVSKFRLK